MTPSSSSFSPSSGGGSGSHAGLAIAATAMALSGTLVLYSLCRAKHLLPSSSSVDDATSPRLRPCLSSSEKRRKKKREMARRGSQKRVRFADDVVDKDKDKDKDNNGAAANAKALTPREEAEPSCGAAAALRTGMPANREALYRGMLRGRSMLRATATCSY